jgi:hypothetical protein
MLRKRLRQIKHENRFGKGSEGNNAKRTGGVGGDGREGGEEEGVGGGGGGGRRCGGGYGG